MVELNADYENSWSFRFQPKPARAFKGLKRATCSSSGKLRETQYGGPNRTLTELARFYHSASGWTEWLCFDATSALVVRWVFAPKVRSAPGRALQPSLVIGLTVPVRLNRRKHV